MAFLFDSDALSEALRKRPLPVPRNQQFSSAVVIGELYKGAFRSTRELVTGNLRHFERIPGVKLHRALADARQR